ncbi:MAG: hypothetical protein WBB01_16275 [Phormidesmis sp.]
MAVWKDSSAQRGMILKNRNWKKLIHRFYPLLLVSLGLHGLALLIPLTPQPETIVEEFKPEPEPIQVSVLPKNPPETTFSPAPAPNPKPPTEVSAQPTPQIAAQPPVATPAPQPALPIPNSTATTPTDATAATATEPAENTTPQAFVPPDTDFATTAQATASFTQDILTAYTNQLANGDISPPELKNIGKGSFGLNYTGDRCFPDKSSVEGSLAVVIDDSPSLLEGEITVGTGYETVNQAIDVWFSQLADPTATQDSNIEVVEQDLFEWIYEKKQPWFAQGESYEAYMFKTTVNLVNNTCLP